MRRLFALTRREWREQRMLVLAFFLLGPLALLAARAVFLESPVDPLPAQVFAPLLAGLLAVALCAEMFVPREGLGALPVSRFTLWMVKISTVLAIAPLFLAWLLACESLRESALGLDTAVAWISDRPGPAWLLAMPLLACVVLCSTLLGRPLAAALLSVLVVLVPVAIFARVGWDGPGNAFLRTALYAHPMWILTVPTATLLAAALAAYAPGDWAPARRRAVRALGAVLTISALSGTWAWADFQDRVSIVPGDPRLGLRSASASPGGRFVALEVQREGPWFESHDRGEPVRAVWIIETTTGEVRELPVGTALTMPDWLSTGSSWSADGELIVTANTGPLHDDDGGRVERIDPASGEVLGSMSVTEWGRGPLRDARRAAQLAALDAEHRFADEESKYRVRSTADGKLAFRMMGAGLRLVDTETGERLLEGAWSPCDLGAHGDGRMLLFHKGPPTTYAMFEAGRERALHVPRGLRVIGLGAGGTLIAMRGKAFDHLLGVELVHIDRDGDVRVLYAPDAPALR